MEADRSRAPFTELVEFARRQHDVFSSRQAIEHGVGDQALYRAVASGKIVRDLPKVYCLPGDRSWKSRLMAAVLWLDRSDAVVSHRAAAALWTLPGFEEGPIELSTTQRKRPLPPVVVHKLTLSPIGDTTTVFSIPVTNAGRALVDVAGLVPADRLECALEDALRRKLTSIAHLRWLCQARSGKGAKGIAHLRSLLSDAHVPTESALEIKLLQSMRKAGLPEPVRQFEVRTNEGRVMRIDLAYPWAKVAIEADGYRFHSGRVAWESDLVRRNVLTSLGWLVIHATHQQLTSDMEGLVARIRDALTPRLGQ
jgi:very-short-patch-repair endonuclease